MIRLLAFLTVLNFLILITMAVAFNPARGDLVPVKISTGVASTGKGETQSLLLFL